jgi:hypothetical protein
VPATAGDWQKIEKISASWIVRDSPGGTVRVRADMLDETQPDAPADLPQRCR